MQPQSRPPGPHSVRPLRSRYYGFDPDAGRLGKRAILRQNDKMKPGAQNNNTIQLATGNVSFPVRLFSLAGRNGLDFDLAIVYNSGGLHKVVDTFEP